MNVDQQNQLRSSNIHPADDEISLYDLFDVLVRKKYIILGITLLVSLAAIIYSLQLTRIYNAEIYFRPPTINDIQGLNISSLAGVEQGESAGEGLDNGLGIKKILEIDPAKIYSDFLLNLQSRQLRFQVFEKVFPESGELESEKRNAFNSLNRSLVFYGAGDKKKEVVHEYLSLQGSDNEKIASYLNVLASTVNDYTVDAVLSDLEIKKGVAISNLKKQVENTLKSAQLGRHDEIERLTEQDNLQRNEILAQIEALRNKAREERMAEIARLDNGDNLRRDEIREKIEILLGQAEVRRNDKIKELEEAIEVAKQAGIIDRTSLNTSFGLDAKHQGNIEIKTEVNPQHLPLYMMGEITLNAELQSLKNRKNDEFFIPGLRDLQKQLIELEKNDVIAALKGRTNDDPYIAELPDLLQKLKLLEDNRKIAQLKNRKDDTPFLPEVRRMEKEVRMLESIKYDKQLVKAAIVDQPAFVPTSPIKPNRKKFVLKALVAGVMLGVFSAFIFSFADSYAEQKKINE
ncbi:MAG: Wzz/FepE/Etk N-terminal domain-containing protein [Desulfobulbaceae bacterium]|nr:Wzz/FepE/Etk N-terminal domain-containing protein [Desulfobulbaceae bacterium]